MGRSRLEGALAAVAALLGAAGLAGWARQAGPAPWTVALAAVLELAVSVAALEAWRRSPERRLGWDGAAWTLDGLALASVDVALDLQWALLLRCRPAQGANAWLWPARGRDPVHWPDLRRAVYSRARPDAPPSRPAQT